VPDLVLIVEKQGGVECKLRENGNTPVSGDAAVTVKRQGGTEEDLVLTDDP
jgi:hypothetical protein